jgi:hypothetical protein
MSRLSLFGQLRNRSVVGGLKGLATTKRFLWQSTDGGHKALRLSANDEIMLIIKRVRLK